MSGTFQVPKQQSTPNLTPSLCFNTAYLRSFLRTSRSQLDDTISTNLNSLLQPSRTSPFDPSSTSDPASPRRYGASKHPIPSPVCADFLQDVLFPTWQGRSKVMNYCTEISLEPDPNDPNKASIEAENEAHKYKTIDERLDPYSARFFPREPRTEVLRDVLRNEHTIEGIVRGRVWRVLAERCEGLDPEVRGWQEPFAKWDKQNRD